MVLSELASLVKLLAGLGILVTLVYLAGQLRQRNLHARRDAQRPIGGPPDFSAFGGGLPDDLARRLASPKPPAINPSRSPQKPKQNPYRDGLPPKDGLV